MAAGSVIGSRTGSQAVLINTLSDYGGFPASFMVGLLGDSDMVGQGVAAAADLGFNLTVPQAPVQYNDQYAISVGLTPPWIYIPGFRSLTSMRPYDNSNLVSMGPELTLAQTLNGLTPTPCVIKRAITGSTLATEWLPTATYPAAGAGNLYNTTVADFHSFEAQVKRPFDAMVVYLGTNDAANAGQAGAFSANMTAMAAALRADFGAGFKIVWVRASSAVPNPFIGTVQTAEDAVDTADANMVLVNYEDLPVDGTFHVTTNGHVTLGQRMSFAVTDLAGIARQTVAVTPQIVGAGPVAFGTGNLTVVPYSGEINGDLEVLVVVVGKVAGTTPTPAGWTLVGSAATTAAGETHRMGVFTRQVTTALLNANAGHMPVASYVFDTTTRNAGKIFTIRGPAANPLVDVSQFTTPNTVGQGPTTLTGVTTTANNELVLLITGGGCGSDPAITTTMAGLTGVTLFQNTNGNILTDREAITVTVGSRAALGATGNGSFSSDKNMVALGCVLGVKP